MNKTYMMLAALALTLASQAQAGVVVVSAKSPATEMDAEGVRRVFLGREQKVGGAPVQLIYQKGGDVRTAFDKGVLNKPGAELVTYWSRLIFTGKAKAPTEVDSDADVKAKLAASPGAIGYISDGAVDASVKVLHKF